MRCPESFVDTWWIRLASYRTHMHKGHFEQGFAHRRVEAEAVGLYESVRLQLLVRVHILAHARRCLEPRGVERGEEQESAELPDVLVTSVQRRLSLC